MLLSALMVKTSEESSTPNNNYIGSIFLCMRDGTTKIVLNADSEANDIDPKLKAFLDYVAGKPSDDEYVNRLEEAVKKAKANKEWRALRAGGTRLARTEVKRRHSL